VERFYILGSGSFLGLNYPIWIMFLAFVAFGTLLNRTVFGRNVLAIAATPKRAACRRARRPSPHWRFCSTGLVAAVAGIVLAARITSGQPNTSQVWSLR